MPGPPRSSPGSAHPGATRSGPTPAGSHCGQSEMCWREGAGAQLSGQGPGVVTGHSGPWDCPDGVFPSSRRRFLEETVNLGHRPAQQRALGSSRLRPSRLRPSRLRKCPAHKHSPGSREGDQNVRQDLFLLFPNSNGRVGLAPRFGGAQPRVGGQGAQAWPSCPAACDEAQHGGSGGKPG